MPLEIFVVNQSDENTIPTSLGLPFLILAIITLVIVIALWKIIRKKQHVDPHSKN